MFNTLTSTPSKTSAATATHDDTQSGSADHMVDHRLPWRYCRSQMMVEVEAEAVAIAVAVA